MVSCGNMLVTPCRNSLVLAAREVVADEASLVVGMGLGGHLTGLRNQAAGHCRKTPPPGNGKRPLLALF